MKKIGITGGIGSGKSIISRILKTMGYPIYDSDSWAKHLMNNHPNIRQALINKFGIEAYTQNGLNRAYLAQQIFNDKANLSFVNSIVHPIVCNHFIQWAENQHSKFVFIESAILFSSGLDKILNKVIYVDAPQELRIQRAILRDKASAEAITARINSQSHDNEYALTHSNFIINNDNQTLIIPQILSTLQNL
jgi:dephospho-CoA kinase